MNKAYRVIVASIVLAGCTRGVIDAPLDPNVYVYAPRNTAELSGAVVVDPFTYIAAPGIAPNEVDIDIFGGKGKFTIPVGEVVADAVRREFRQSGIVTSRGNCRMNGEISSLYATYTLVSSTFYGTMRFVLKDNTGRDIIDVTHASSSIEPNPARGDEAVFSRRIYAVLADNISALMSDKTFLVALSNECSK